MLALVLQVIWNFGTEGLMNEFGGTGCPGVAEIIFWQGGSWENFYQFDFTCVVFSWGLKYIPNDLVTL